MPAVVRLYASRGNGDCAIIALASYLSLPYEDVLTAVSKTVDSVQPHNDGVSTPDMIKVAARLGVKLSVRRKFNLGRDEGIVMFEVPGAVNHVAFCKNGMVAGMDATWWEYPTYLARFGYRPVSLLVTK